jgi:hypothetical protein
MATKTHKPIIIQPSSNFTQADGVSLRDYVDKIDREIVLDYDEKIEALEEKLMLAVNLQFKALQTSIDKAEESNRLSHANMNEWRAESKDRMTTYLSKSEYDVKHELLISKIESLQKLIYMGLGAVWILELFLKFFLK